MKGQKQKNEQVKSNESSKWTNEEHEQFVKFIKKHKKNWRRKPIPNCTKSFRQIISHYELYYNKATNDSTIPNANLFLQNYHSNVNWTNEQHEQFIEAIKKFKTEWRKYASLLVTDKSEKQIGGHYEHYYAKALQDRTIPNAELLIENYYNPTKTRQTLTDK